MSVVDTLDEIECVEKHKTMRILAIMAITAVIVGITIVGILAGIYDGAILDNIPVILTGAFALVTSILTIILAKFTKRDS